jgi:hypothetical protein
VLMSLICSQNKFVRDDDNYKERQTLKEICEYGLSNCLQQYLDILLHNKGTILTMALRTVIKSAPTNLSWKTQPSCGVSFCAYDTKGYHYTINSFTGVILVNGLPPSQLPLGITNNQLYRRIFARNNFEVILKSGYYETTHPVFNCFYRFHQINDQVIIQESSPQGCTTKSNDSDLWQDPLEFLSLSTLRDLECFPTKLRLSFSHWVSRRHNTVVFRQFDFRNKEIYFIHHITDCKIVPKHLEARNEFTTVMRASHEMDSLVVHNSQVLKFLERLESKDMILTEISNITKERRMRLHRFSIMSFNGMKLLDFT